jgi:hypothetical protein
MAVTKKTLVSKNKRVAAPTAIQSGPTPKATVPPPGASSIHQVVAKKLAVGKLVTAKGIR